MALRKAGGFEKSRLKKKSLGLPLSLPLLKNSRGPVVCVVLVVWPLLPFAVLKCILAPLHSDDLPTWVVLVGGVVGVFCHIIVLFNARVDSNEVFKHAYLGLKTASGCQTYVVGPGHGTPGCACRGSHTSSGSLEGGSVSKRV